MTLAEPADFGLLYGFVKKRAVSVLATCDTDATRKKEGRSRFFVALHGFCERNSPHCSVEGENSMRPSSMEPEFFRRSPHPAPASAVSEVLLRQRVVQSFIPRPPFPERRESRMRFPRSAPTGTIAGFDAANVLGREGPEGEALLRKGPFFPHLPLSADAYEAPPSAPRLCPQWRTIQNSRGGVGKRHVFGTRFPV